MIGTSTSAAVAGSTSAQNRVDARARQADRVDHPARHLGDARRGVAGARLGRDRLRDVRGAAERRVAEHRVGGPRVERARRVQHRVRELQARRGRSREALRRHDRPLDAEPLPRAVAARPRSRSRRRSRTPSAPPAPPGRRCRRRPPAPPRPAPSRAGPDASTSSTPVRSTSSVTSRGASATSRAAAGAIRSSIAACAASRNPRPRRAPAAERRRRARRRRSRRCRRRPAASSRRRRRPGRTRGRAATARRASRARASAPTEYAGSTRNAGVPSGSPEQPDRARQERRRRAGSRTIANVPGGPTSTSPSSSITV